MITGPGDHYIAPERRCDTCGLLLGGRETSPCAKCEARTFIIPECSCSGCIAARAVLAEAA